MTSLVRWAHANFFEFMVGCAIFLLFMFIWGIHQDLKALRDTVEKLSRKTRP